MQENGSIISCFLQRNITLNVGNCLGLHRWGLYDGLPYLSALPKTESRRSKALSIGRNRRTSRRCTVKNGEKLVVLSSDVGTPGKQQPLREHTDGRSCLSYRVRFGNS